MQEVLNAVPLTMSDRISDITGMNFEYCDSLLKTLLKLRKLFSNFVSKAPLGHYTRGLYEKESNKLCKVQFLVEMLKV